MVDRLEDSSVLAEAVLIGAGMQRSGDGVLFGKALVDDFSRPGFKDPPCAVLGGMVNVIEDIGVSGRAHGDGNGARMQKVLAA